MSNDSDNIQGLSRFLLSQLAEEITNTPFKSSVRLIILLSLGISGKMRLTDLMLITGCGKGSISNHIKKLEESGFITTRDVSVFTSSRIVVEITNKGVDFYNRYLNMVESIVRKFKEYESNKV